MFQIYTVFKQNNIFHFSEHRLLFNESCGKNIASQLSSEKWDQISLSQQLETKNMSHQCNTRLQNLSKKISTIPEKYKTITNSKDAILAYDEIKNDSSPRNDGLKIALIQTALKFSNTGKYLSKIGNTITVDSFWGPQMDNAWKTFKKINNITKKINLKDNKGEGFNGIMNEIKKAFIRHYGEKFFTEQPSPQTKKVPQKKEKKSNTKDIEPPHLPQLTQPSQVLNHIKNLNFKKYVDQQNIKNMLGSKAFNSNGLNISKQDITFSSSGEMYINISNKKSILHKYNGKLKIKVLKVQNTTSPIQIFIVHNDTEVGGPYFNFSVVLDGVKIQQLLKNILPNKNSNAIKEAKTI